MKISQTFPSKYLRASDISGKTPHVFIASIRMEDIGDDEQKPVLYFQGKDKGIILNKTNATNVSLAYGDDTDAWIGKEIILFTAWVDFQGKSVEAIRVRPSPQPQQRQPASTTQTAPGGGDLDDSVPF